MSDRIHVVTSVIVRGGRVLLQQRDPRGSYPLTWETAGGKVEPGETPEAALVRELWEELGIEATIGEVLHRASFDPATDSDVRRAFDCTYLRVAAFDGTPTPKVAIGLGWFLPEEFLSLSMTPATDHFQAHLMVHARRSE